MTDYNPPSFNSFKYHAQNGTMRGQYKAATVLVTPRGMTPHLLGDAMPSDSTLPIHVCQRCNTSFGVPAKRRNKPPRFCSKACWYAFTRLPENATRRFWEKTNKQAEDKCWRWQANKNPAGYGRFWWNGHFGFAHRFAYEAFVGPIPSGMILDHVLERGCVHRDCVNPNHLEVVTNKENSLRGQSPMAINAKKTHCPHGHPYSGANLYLCKTKTGAVSRKCRTCFKVLVKKWLAKKKGK